MTRLNSRLDIAESKLVNSKIQRKDKKTQFRETKKVTGKSSKRY